MLFLPILTNSPLIAPPADPTGSVKSYLDVIPDALEKALSITTITSSWQTVGLLSIGSGMDTILPRLRKNTVINDEEFIEQTIPSIDHGTDVEVCLYSHGASNSSILVELRRIKEDT